MTGLGLVFLPSLLRLKLPKKQPLFCLPQSLFLENREQRRAGIFPRELSKLVVELGLEPTVLPTSHLTAGVRQAGPSGEVRETCQWFH